jgi:hypothetical protein
MRHDPWEGHINQSERAVHIAPGHVGKYLQIILKRHSTKDFDYILEDLKFLKNKKYTKIVP